MPGFVIDLPSAISVNKQHIINKLKADDCQLIKQEAFEKCWAHSPLRVAVTLPFTRCRYCRMPAIAIAQAACYVHDDDNENARQRGPLWPHGMGPMNRISKANLPTWYSHSST